MSAFRRKGGDLAYACQRQASPPVQASVTGPFRSQTGFAQALQEVITALAARFGPARGGVVGRAAHLSRQVRRADCAFVAWRGSCWRGRHDGL